MITELRILPPLAIARLGSSPEPLENYTIEIPTKEPLAYRSIKPAETLQVDPASGEIIRAYTPDAIKFRDGARIRPVAPFLEVWARTDDDVLEPLTLDLLRAEGAAPDRLHEHVRWTVHVGNIKMWRRTGNDDDRVYADISFSDHHAHALDGRCNNFLPGKVLPLGSVQFIRPNAQFPEIRMRFTPAAGKVYGASDTRRTGPNEEEPDTVIAGILYDKSKKSWFGHREPVDFEPEKLEKGQYKIIPRLTNPADVYAGYQDTDDQGNDKNEYVSWGYIDDECDGIVSVEVTLPGREAPLRAFARIGAGPPAFAPDSLPVRTVAHDLEQALLGPVVGEADVTVEAAEAILRQALDSVRLMNTAVMNANAVNGRVDVASTMVRQDTGDTGRRFEPIMSPSLVDQLAVVGLHERVLAALASGTAPWFADVLRQPEEVGDLSDKGRRKMPALMRGADGRHLALTRRQIDLIVKAAMRAMLPHAPGGPQDAEEKDEK